MSVISEDSEPTRMDCQAEFGRIIETMEWEDVVSALQATTHELLDDTPSMARPSPPIPGPEDHTYPQAGGTHGPVFQDRLMDPGPLSSQEAANVQGQVQYLVEFIIKPVLYLPDDITQRLHPIGSPNGLLFNELPAAARTQPVPVPVPVPAAAPQTDASTPQKETKHEDQQKGGQQYVKKPLNAFMIFLQEQRAFVKSEFNFLHSAAVNKILGQRWKSMTREQQDPYYNRAETEKQRHAQRHPLWTCRENYGKKRMRGSSIASTITGASAPAVNGQARTGPETPTESAPIRPCNSMVVISIVPQGTMPVQLPHTQDLAGVNTVAVQPSETQATSSAPVCDSFRQSHNTFDFLSLDFLGTTSAAPTPAPVEN